MADGELRRAGNGEEQRQSEHGFAEFCADLWAEADAVYRHYAASGNINRKYQDLVRNIDVLKFPHHGILDDKTNTYEIGVALTRVLSPTYVLIPGAASVWEIWNFIAAYSAEQNLTRDHVYNNRFGNIVLLTDGETIEVCTNVDPADFNPYQPSREVTAQ